MYPWFMKWRFIHVAKIRSSNTRIRLCKTRKIPVYLKVIGTFAQEIFWIERIMRRVPCIFLRVTRASYIRASFYFAERGALVFAVWVEYLGWMCERACTPASCRYVHKHREECGRGGKCVDLGILSWCTHQGTHAFL